MVRSVSKIPEGARYLASFIDFRGGKIPEELIDGTIENLYHATWLIVTLLLHGKDWASIPKRLVDSILSDPYSVGIVASSLYKTGKEVSEGVIDAVARDP
jgi:hypothetical protein